MPCDPFCEHMMDLGVIMIWHLMQKELGAWYLCKSYDLEIGELNLVIECHTIRDQCLACIRLDSAQVEDILYFCAVICNHQLAWF